MTGVGGDEAQLRCDIAASWGQVASGLDAVGRQLAALLELVGPDATVAEASLAARMAASVVGPVAATWAGDRGSPTGGETGFDQAVGAALRAALAAGSAHVETQSGVPYPCVPGVEPAAQGLAATAGGGWEPAVAATSTALYWLEDRGASAALAVGGSDLAAMIKDGRRELAGRSERGLLAAALEAGAVVVDRRNRGWSQMVKVARRSRRMVLVPAEVVFPADSETSTGPGAPPGPAPAGTVELAPPGPRGATPAPGTPPEAAGGPAPPQVPPWLMERVNRLPAETRVELLTRFADAGVLGRTLTHEELAAVERWLSGAERTAMGVAFSPRAPIGGPRAAVPRPEPVGPRAAPAGRTAPGMGAARYRYLATDGRRLISSTGDAVEGPWAHAGELVDAARQLVASGDVIIVVHPSAHFFLGLPERQDLLGERDDDGFRHAFARGAFDATTSVREVGRAGGLIVESAGKGRAQLLFPGYSGEFADAADAAELLEAVELFCGALDFGYSYSAAASLHRLVEFTQNRRHPLGPPAGHPDLDPPFLVTGYSVPATAWSRPLTGDEAAKPWVVVCDRSGSYLSAWGSCVVADGAWAHRAGPFPLPPAAELKRVAGYWLLDCDQLAQVTPRDLPDPFLRHGGADADAVWVSTPLAELAAELAGESKMTVLGAWAAAEAIRPLDQAAKRLSTAREQLIADPRPAARVALDTLKAGYAAATSWFEYGPQPPSPLARPQWRRSILDRYVANTWRSLAKGEVAPFALTDVDAALFAVTDAGAVPPGLRAGGALGAWKTKGRPVAMGEAVEALGSGGPRAVVRLAEEPA
jgi:hypothetical protein